MNTLPNDCILLILSFCGKRNLLKISQINKHFNKLCENESLWKFKITEDNKIFFELCKTNQKNIWISKKSLYLYSASNYYGMERKRMFEAYFQNFSAVLTGRNKHLIHKLLNLRDLLIKNSDFPISIFKIITLTNLDFTETYLGSVNKEPTHKLSKGISLLINLKSLNLSYNYLKNIPSSIFKLTNLTYLNVCNNKIRFIPKKIKKLTKIQTLNLSSNKIVKIKNIFTLNTLTCLFLQNNLIKNICFKELTQLVKLNLNNCNLSKIPENISNLTNLEFIDLSNNSLLEISGLKSILKKNGLYITKFRISTK